jgi:hypothetical protein
MSLLSTACGGPLWLGFTECGRDCSFARSPELIGTLGSHTGFLTVDMSKFVDQLLFQ